MPSPEVNENMDHLLSQKSYSTEEIFTLLSESNPEWIQLKRDLRIPMPKVREMCLTQIQVRCKLLKQQGKDVGIVLTKIGNHVPPGISDARVHLPGNTDELLGVLITEIEAIQLILKTCEGVRHIVHWQIAAFVAIELLWVEKHLPDWMHGYLLDLVKTRRILNWDEAAGVDVSNWS